MKDQTFDEFEEILNQGYQVYFTYLENRYLVFKTNDNCYTKKLVYQGSKSTSEDGNDNKKISK